MKKILSGILALTCMTSIIYSAAAEEADIIYGDINGNGVVDLTDLSYLSLYLLGDCALTHQQTLCADVDGSGEVNIADLPHLKQYIMHDSAVPFLGPARQTTKTRLSSGDFAAFYLSKLPDVKENTLFIASSIDDLKEFGSSEAVSSLSEKGIDVKADDFFKNNIILCLYPKYETDTVYTLDSIDFDNSNTVTLNISKSEAVNGNSYSRADIITAIIPNKYFSKGVEYTFQPEYSGKVLKSTEANFKISTVTIRTGSFPIMLEKKAIAVTDMDTFKKYAMLSAVNTNGGNAYYYLTEGIGDLPETDPDFFNSNILILTTSTASSGSCDASVKKVYVEDGKVTVTLEQKTPKADTIVTDDMGAWLQITTIPKEYIKDADLSNINVETVYKEF